MGIAEIRKLKNEPKPKKEKKPLAKIGAKKAARLAAEKEAGTDGAMDKFFISLRPKMKNKCLFCGGKTMKEDDEKFFFSLAHLLPKNLFPSVALMPENVIELCFYAPSCHTNFDNGTISWEFIRDSKEWNEISERLYIILPQVAHEERKHKLYSKLENLLYNKNP